MESQLILPDRKIFIPGTIKPESDYIEHERLCAELGLPCPQAFVKLEVHMPNGKLVDSYEDRSRTLNRNYWNMLFRIFACLNQSGGGLSTDTTFGAGHLSTKTTAAAVNNANISSIRLTALGGAGDATAGLVAGTTTTAESFEHNALQAVIANGTSAGQMSYAAMTFVQPTYNAGTLTWTQTAVRILNNNSGGSIGVNETGYYVADNGGSMGNSMFMRDKLGATVTVANTGQLTITYTFTLVFPA